MPGRGLAIAATTLGLSVAGCGADETRYSDDEIIDKLNLEQAGAGFTIDGDPFCEVEKKLLNTSDEVQSAADKDDLGLVVASREGNVGVQGVPPGFPPDCGDAAKKKLSRLDPAPSD